jgi:hypothetical protein
MQAASKKEAKTEMKSTNLATSVHNHQTVAAARCGAMRAGLERQCPSLRTHFIVIETKGT